MKAVVLAGGKGTRLSPLTLKIPKPLVPVLDKPVLAHILALLNKHGIHDAALTLAYLPKLIENRFLNESLGVNLNYFTEEIPLGTAGSVKNASEFLLSDKDDSFLVISGDTMCDIDLSKAIEFHRSKNADLTVVLKKSDKPLQFGVVKTNPEGKIERFVEKPRWSQICSDKVNTGIYIIKKHLLSSIPKGRFFDFAKDLFPLMMERQEKLFGFVTEDYWCDIGSVSSLLRCNYDALAGKIGINLPLDGKIHSVGEDRYYLSYGAKVDEGTLICNNTIIGRDCTVEKNSLISGTVLCEGATVKEGSVIKNAVICQGAEISKNSLIIGRSFLPDENNPVCPETYALRSNEDDELVDDDGELCFKADADKELLARFSDAFLSINNNNIIYLNQSPKWVTEYLYAHFSSKHQKVFLTDADTQNMAAYCSCIGSGQTLFCFEKDNEVHIKIFDKDGFVLSSEKRSKLISAFRSARSVPVGERVEAKSFFVKNLYYCALYSRRIKPQISVSVKGEIPSLFADLLREKQVEVKKDAFLCLDFENSGVLLQKESFFDFDHVRALIIKSQPNKRVFVPAQSYFVLNSLGYKVFSLDEKQSTEDFKLIDYPEIFDELFTFAALLELYGDWGDKALLKKFKSLPSFSTYSTFRPFSGSAENFTERINKLFFGFDSEDERGIVLKDELSKINVTPCALKGFRVYVQSRKAESAKELCDFVVDKLNI